MQLRNDQQALVDWREWRDFIYLPWYCENVEADHDVLGANYQCFGQLTQQNTNVFGQLTCMLISMKYFALKQGADKVNNEY